MQTTRGTRREVRGTLAKTVLAYVRRVLGPDAVESVFEVAGLQLAAEGLAQPASWTTAHDTVAIAQAAAQVCGDPDIGRRAGEELMRMMVERGTVDFLRATGSIQAAIGAAIGSATKMSAGRRFDLVEIGDDHAVLRGVYTDRDWVHPFFCAHTAGFFGLVPDVFGHSGAATELECMGRGAAACHYRVAWSPAPIRSVVSVGDAAAVEASQARMESFVGRFEQLHAMATELAGAEEVDTLLARITERAGVAVSAQRYLLAVRTADTRPLSIHHYGFSDDDAAGKFASQLLSGELDDTEGVLVAEVASSRRTYGRLAARFPGGSAVNDMERRLLAAYARHAAVALEAVAALETARRDRDSAEALLSLAHALAEVGTEQDVAGRLAAAVPAVAHCDRSGVWLWDQDSQCLRLGAEFPDDRADGYLRPVLRAAEVSSLSDVIRNPQPFIVGIDDAEPPVRALMEADGLERCAVVPMRARGEFLGFVAAGFAETNAVFDVFDDGAMLTRMRGLADQAATALDNGRLLDAIRRQALHDALTGLANRTLLEDRARQTLRLGRRSGQSTSLLFVDLDGFKSVNDELGHDMGDELIRQAAERIVTCVRASDTAARVGGDEFVVLLPDTPSAAANVVAEKITDAFHTTFPLAGIQVKVTCSVGVATATDDGDYRELLRGADAAMYAVKAAKG